MSGRIPEDLVAEVLARADILEVIGEYVRLERKGRNYLGLCPFHQEKTPSFTVTPEKQMFYCFGCGAGGNIFKFIMLKENLTFPESVRWLAERVGVHIPEHAPAQNPEQERAWRANALARDFYRETLEHDPAAQAARDYLDRRGITAATRQRFELGFAPAGWDALLRFLGRHGYTPEDLVRLGLAVRSERGSVYDRFRNRIIFPVHNVRGQVVGFGGRVMDDSQPKYLNSPETPVFAKGRELYGLHLARQSIREQGLAAVVEGYMDVITAHQHGQENVVASLGTALTREQARLLTRYTMDAVIAYDADAAGVAATIRGLDILQDSGCRVRVVSIPDGKDPDDYLRQHGAGEWRSLVDRAASLLEYKLQHALAQTGASTVSQKLVVLRQVLPALRGMNSEVEREEGIQTIARALGLSWETVRGEWRKFAARGIENWPDSDKIAKKLHNMIGKRPPARQKAEAGLLYLILENPALIDTVRQELGEAFFADAGHQRIFDTLVRRAGEPGFQPALLVNYLGENDAALFSGILARERPLGEPRDLIEALRRLRARETKRALLADLAAAERAGDREQVNRLLLAIKELTEGSRERRE
ncbi:MAG: DNA primase [Bacillota bacterium]|nr:DNA primase [Bacillota bacterium]